MKKILFVITKSNWGGAQRYVYNLATSLPNDQFDVAVAFGGTGLPGAPTGALEERLKSAGVRTLFVTSFARDIFLLKDVAAFFELVHLFKKERPDVIHLNSSKAGGVGAAAGRVASIKNIVFTSHGLAYDEDRNLLARLVIFFFTWITFLLCHHVILISKDTLRRASRLPFCKSKCRLIYNGLPSLQFEDREAARIFIATRTNANLNEGIWIATMAELVRNKALDSLIGAAAHLRQSGAPPFHLFIMGEGEERRALEAHIEKCGLQKVVHLVGFVPESYRYMKAFDIFSLVSVKEGLPYVLLEAGQAGLPVVASRIAGVTDIVEDGVSGLLVTPKNEKEIAERLGELIANADKRSSLGMALREKVVRDFSVERMTESMITLYH
ncbi:glycosyltransferase family 1 protein [bacterium]|nr:MAG: glycosyltransferase family 1 protein [bacterium]